ncbi:MAG TPA: anthrone oxygenase family protein [Steroidobacteraceae bacterium]|nr:anthrone oxygenase family protein [Steroidobacteraceae bacterium]
MNWTPARSSSLLAASLLYVLGTFIATMIFNVPKNDALAALKADASTSIAYWHEYLVQWTFRNHVRTACAALATVLFAFALLHRF